jgi:lipopolysaccharide biosynthesis glycosyltransferase
MRNFDNQEKRVIGHISERLLNIFLINKAKKDTLKIKELQRTFVKNETFNGKLKPAFLEKNIPIAICFDDNYALSGGALVNSIVKNSNNNENYDIVILENNVSERNKHRLKSLIKNKSNFSLRFFDVNAFSEMKSVYTRAHFSAATYARLFIPKIFCDFCKVIFIDADTVTESDLAELTHIEMGNNLISAVRDIVMEGFVKFGAVAHTDDDKQLSAKEYLNQILNMPNTDNYFQAGIIVFNIKQMNIENTYEKLMTAMKSRSFWFLDQDIMNKVFYDRVYYLPPTWNVYHGNGNTNDFFPNLKFSTYMQFLESRKEPKMIHFAGENKPWDTPFVDFFDNFMSYVYNTPWQKEVYDRLSHRGTTISLVTNNNDILFQTKVKRKIMPYFNRFAPIGSKRRQVIAKNYYKIRRVLLG